MVLPASGQLTTAQILAEFNQTGEFVTSSYYRGGGIVPATSGVTGGVAEVQTVGFSGTASNTISPGQDETITIALDNRFNSGRAVATGFTISPTADFSDTGTGSPNFAVTLSDSADTSVYRGTRFTDDDGNEIIISSVQGSSGSFTAFVVYADGITITAGTDYTVVTTGPSTYSFDIDTSDTVFSGTVTGTFATNANASAALTTLGSAVTTMFSTVTASAVTTGDVTITETFSTRDTTYSGFDFPDDSWDIRDGQFINSSNSVSYTSWDDMVGNWLALPFSNLPFARDNLVPATITLSFGAASATFNVADEFLDQAELTSIVTQTGTPDTSGELTVSETIDTVEITLDTNQTADIAQILNITANDGAVTTPIVTVLHGTVANNISSTYTITDYDNMQVGVGTATSAETLNSALTRMVTAVNLNTETPIDFRGAVDGSDLVLTAQSVGSLNPGAPSTSLWSITVDHSTGDGDIAVTGVTRTTRGRDTLSNINANVPDGSQGNTEITLPDDFHGATRGDN